MNTPFYQQNLVEVSSPALVKRYNDALESLSLKPTKLSSFHVDSRGWSPEIAKEQNNNYLSHGPANALAVILSPDQKDKPVYTPLTSFDKDVLQRYYAQFSSEIADLTRDIALCLELDHTPPSYLSPEDALTFQGVTVKTSAGGFGDAVSEQAALVKTFLEDENAWSDASLRQNIIANAKAHGDLRGRAALPADFTVNDISSFSAELFGGLFVLRPPRANSYLILKDKSEMPDRRKNTFHLQDSKLLPKLLKENLIAVDESYYREHLDVLVGKFDALLADALFQLEPTLNFAKLSTAQRKQRISQYSGQLPEVLFELESFMSKISTGAKIRSSELSRELIYLLLHPHSTTQEQEREVLWQLICQAQVLNVEPLDIVQLYQKDIAHFFQLYQSWPGVRQEWAENYLMARGIIS
jgi:hypothetical protein